MAFFVKRSIVQTSLKHCQKLQFYKVAHALGKSRYCTVCVEGNIGCGKSTILEYFKSNVPDVEVCQEPVHRWQSVAGGNLLGLMYKDPDRWSYTFQTYTLLTMMQLHSEKQVKEHRIIERSAYSAVYCFVENLFLSGHMSKLEYSIHHEWFKWLKKVQTPKVDLIVYIRTSPSKCLERVKARGRTEEADLSLTLLEQIHDRYEDWLSFKSKFIVPAPVLVIDGNKPVEEMVHDYYEQIDSILNPNTNNHIRLQKLC